MKFGASAIPDYLLDIRSILVGFAIFNFTTVWIMDAEIHFTCAACPWYHPWSYLNEPTILLAACLFLRVNRWWGNTVALLLTLYLIGYFVHLFLLFADPVSVFILSLKRLPMFYPYIVTSWESQYLLALILFCYAVISLPTNLRSRRMSHASKN